MIVWYVIIGTVKRIYIELFYMDTMDIQCPERSAGLTIFSD